jgi:Zn-dependent M28 family amino/carboxypeptidase
MAHYDTKSQLLPTGVRVALVAGVTALCGVGVLLGVLTLLGHGAASAVPRWIIGIAALVCLTGLACNVTGNSSPGALDNGSAVGTLLELARAWRPLPHAPLEVFWVASGAEEVGLEGARYFLRQRETWWYEKPTLLINLESVGAGSHVYLAGEPRSLQLARASAEALKVPHSRLRVVGAGMDHEPFAARGLAAVTILGDVVRSSLALHSARDDMRLIDPLALERAGRLAAHLAWRWAELHASQPSKGPHAL